MPSHKSSRTEWHLKSGKWTRSLGCRGARVRLFQKEVGACSTARSGFPRAGLVRNVWEPLTRRKAETLANALLAAL